MPLPKLPAYRSAGGAIVQCKSGLITDRWECGGCLTRSREIRSREVLLAEASAHAATCNALPMRRP
ncbi:hypothetical protein ACFVXG_07705 [Kitasatospora sp. NPDC058162]|uniref:hypothetical protein n=1 Tax=Kitasatospora sp. NPDC058162 TaxID=3346362 RepID=UPI0036DAF03F